MAQRSQNIMVMQSMVLKKQTWLLSREFIRLRNDAKLTIAHVIDTRALQKAYPPLMLKLRRTQVDAESLMKEYENVPKMLVYRH